MLVSTWIWTRGLPGSQKSWKFLSKALSLRHYICCEQNIVGKIGKQQPLLNWYETWFKFDPNMYKIAFSDIRITEIKKKMHIDIQFLYILTQKLHWKSAGINKDSNSNVDHCVGSINYVTRKIYVLIENNPIIRAYSKKILNFQSVQKHLYVHGTFK